MGIGINFGLEFGVNPFGLNLNHRAFAAVAH